MVTGLALTMGLYKKGVSFRAGKDKRTDSLGGQEKPGCIPTATGLMIQRDSHVNSFVDELDEFRHA